MRGVRTLGPMAAESRLVHTKKGSELPGQPLLALGRSRSSRARPAVMASGTASQEALRRPWRAGVATEDTVSCQGWSASSKLPRKEAQSMAGMAGTGAI